MTREEAIIELKKKITCTIGGLSKEEYNATIMAIEALSADVEKPCKICGCPKDCEYDRPSFEAIQVVHCKDCKWWLDNIGYYRVSYCPWNEDVEIPDADDFCSRGEMINNE